MKVVDEGIIWYIYITCYVLLMPYMWAGMTFLQQSMISVMFPLTILYSVCRFNHFWWLRLTPASKTSAVDLFLLTCRKSRVLSKLVVVSGFLIF